MNQCCNDIPAQGPSLFTSVRWPKASTPKREQILDTINKAVLWDELESIARAHYRSDINAVGRRGYSLKMLVRCLVLQMLWRMSDRQLENTVLDSHALAKFIGTDPWAPRPPSASAVRTFRKTLSDAEVGVCESAYERLASTFNDHLRKSGAEFRAGLIQDPIFKRSQS